MLIFYKRHIKNTNISFVQSTIIICALCFLIAGIHITMGSDAGLPFNTYSTPWVLVFLMYMLLMLIIYAIMIFIYSIRTSKLTLYKQKIMLSVSLSFCIMYLFYFIIFLIHIIPGNDGGF